MQTTHAANWLKASYVALGLNRKIEGLNNFDALAVNKLSQLFPDLTLDWK